MATKKSKLLKAIRIYYDIGSRKWLERIYNGCDRGPRRWSEHFDLIRKHLIDCLIAEDPTLTGDELSDLAERPFEVLWNMFEEDIRGTIRTREVDPASSPMRLKW